VAGIGEERIAMGAKLLLTVWLSLAAASQAMAQTTDEGVWTALSMRGRVKADSSWRWAADALARSRDGVATLDFLGAGITLIRDITSRTSVGASYLYAVGFPISGPLFEHRFVQQLAWKIGGRRVVSFKTRVEERFVTGRNAMVRVRQQARVVWPLVLRGRLLAIVSEELLMQSDARALAFGLDSNRLFAGIGRRLTPRSAVEAGYLNVYSRHGASSQRRHVMSIAVSTTW
jgi:hypothetical protein